MSANNRDLLLVADPGGHLFELLALEAVWKPYSRAWVTLRDDALGAIAPGELVFLAHGPTRRSVANLFRNALLAFRVIREVRPSALITTGAGVSVPFVWMAKAMGVKTAYIESSGRLGMSLTGKLVSPVANRVYVQWRHPGIRRRRVRYAGSVLFSADDLRHRRYL